MRRVIPLMLVAMVGTLLCLTLADAQERHRLAPVQFRPAPKMEAPPQAVNGPIRDKLRERIALRVIKAKTIKHAMTVGIEGKKLSRAEAEAAYGRLEKDLGDDGILALAVEAAPMISTGLVGGPLTDFLDWLLANAPAIIELIMKLLPLFV